MDAIRGIAILCIVIYHTLLWYYLSDPTIVWAPAAEFWGRFNAILGSVRVPLLLLVSGLVASKRLRAGLTDRLNLVRAGTNYYLYVVWLILYAAFFAIVAGPPLPHRISSWTQLISELVVPDTTLWYLAALCVYILLTAATARWPRPVVLILAVLAYVAADVYLPVELQATKIPQNWLFFLIGVYLGPALPRLPRFATLPAIAGAAVVTAAVIAVGGRIPDLLGLRSLHAIVRSITMVTTAVLGTIWVTRFGWLRRGLSFLGSRTLAIYLLHPLAIYLLIALATAYPVVNRVLDNPVGAAIGPIFLTALITAGGIVARQGADLARLNWLFTLPRSAPRSGSRPAADAD